MLVLEAGWFGKPCRAGGRACRAPEADGRPHWPIGRDQRWPLPPVFRRQDLPWPGVTNRQTWIASPAYPLVEEIRRGHAGAEPLRLGAELSRLGRSNLAGAKWPTSCSCGCWLKVPRGPEAGSRSEARWRLLYPAAAGRQRLLERPVLAAAIRQPRAGAE